VNPSQKRRHHGLQFLALDDAAGEVFTLGDRAGLVAVGGGRVTAAAAAASATARSTIASVSVAFIGM